MWGMCGVIPRFLSLFSLLSSPVDVLLLCPSNTFYYCGSTHFLSDGLCGDDVIRFLGVAKVQL